MNYFPEAGKFNTNADALSKRIEAHDKFGSNDLNAWIFEHLDLKVGAHILDLGCGTGKQSLPLAQMIGESGRVFSFDAAQSALDTLMESAKNIGVAERIVVKMGTLDELESHLHDREFDVVVGSFSLYYAAKPSILFDTIFRHLKPGGSLFFCGPSKKNNAELKHFHNSLLVDKQQFENRSAIFMEDIGRQMAESVFAKVELYTFQNPLQFNSPESLYKYWSSYNLYNENIDAEFRGAAAKYFALHTTFETTKRVIGVKAVKTL